MLATETGLEPATFRSTVSPGPNGSHLTRQTLTRTPKSHGPQFGPQAGQKPGTNRQPARPAATFQTPGTATGDCTGTAPQLNPGEGDAPATPAPAPTAPGTALEAAQSAPDALAGVVAQLRDELAAQRAENAALRKTIEALTAALAKLAGAGAGND